MKTSVYFLFSVLSLAELLTATAAISHTQEHLKTLLENDDSSAFSTSVSSGLGFNAPSLQDLTKMFNEINVEKVPHPIAIFEYVLNDNINTTFSITNNNTGKAHSLSYGLKQSQNNGETFSSLYFNFIEGQLGDFPYKTGVSFFSHVDYTQSESNVTWRGSTTGVFLNHAKNGRYEPYGNYTATSEGHIATHPGHFLEFTCDTLSFMNTDIYSTKNVENYRGTGEPEGYAMNVNIFSLTGGSNSTLSVYGSNGEKAQVRVNGTISNVDKQAKMESVSNGFALHDPVNPLGDANIQGIFNIPYAGVGIFI